MISEKMIPANFICPKCGKGNYMRYLIPCEPNYKGLYDIKCVNCNSYYTLRELKNNLPKKVKVRKRGIKINE